MKKIFILLIVMLLFSLSSFAEDAQISGGGGFSYVKTSEGDPVGVFTMKPNIGLGALSLGFDINIYMPDKKRPKGYPYVALRHIAYDDGTNGLKYGVLSGVTYGFGLIMKDYSTLKEPTMLFDPDQAGVEGYTNMFFPYGIKFLGTNSRVFGLRVDYTAQELALLGKPVIFGINYMHDIDGVDTLVSKNVGARQTAYSGDISWSVWDDAGTLFAEIAQFEDYDSGFMTGLTGKLLIFDYMIDYRSFGAQFEPGYFNSTYERGPVDLSDPTRKSQTGYHTGLGFEILNLIYFQADYEDYGKPEDQTINALLDVKKIQDFSGTLKYHQKGLKDIGGAILTFNGRVPASMVGIPYPGNVNVIYQRTYITTKKFDETYSLGYGFSF